MVFPAANDVIGQKFHEIPVSPTQFALQNSLDFGSPPAENCAICGGPAYGFVLVEKRLSGNFTDYDYLSSSRRMCIACEWFMSGSNTQLQQLLGRDKPQKAINYSFVVKDGQLYILSKAHKSELAALLHGTVPELAAIALTGQKHIIFKSRVNEPEQSVGWMNLEEQTFWFSAETFEVIHQAVTALYEAGHSKDAILTGQYRFYPDMDISLWRDMETVIRPYRGDLHLEVSVYLAQRSSDV